MEELIVECIRTILMDDGYTAEKANVTIQYGYADIRPIIERIKCEKEKE